MRLAAHQPYFFPYLGYFSVIARCDCFIFFDVSQYVRHSWINRNRILADNAGWKWLVIPVGKNAPLGTPINDVLLNDSFKKENILHELSTYKRYAPYYTDVMDLFEDCLKFETRQLSELNIYCTRKVCDYLGIKTELKTFSSMGIKLPPVSAPDEWGLNLTLAMGAKVYANSPGGQEFYNREKYENKGLKLELIKSKLPEYHRGGKGFEPALSIIDVLMFNDREAVYDMINEIEILR